MLPGIRQLLQTAEHVVFWMDHKKLEYIRSAKRLNSHQASAYPSSHLYLPAKLHSEALQWGHSFRITCHPECSRGYQRPLFPEQKEASIPSVQALIQQCRHVEAGLLHTASHLRLLPAFRLAMCPGTALCPGTQRLAVYSGSSAPSPV
ncbi:unnamed protein product [Merluccius merluccius]